jgi:RpiR family carbohydrate utilization transcriptional regulator
VDKADLAVVTEAITKAQEPLVAAITALAKSAQVSEPTVVRFCRTLGYDGWHEFKLKLAQGLALALPAANEQPAQDDLAADLVNKICSRSINTLLDLRNNLNAESVQKALDILSRANKIEFYGQGTSGFVAADAQHKFFRSGVPTVAYTDPSIHSIAAALLREGDALVAISQRGNNPALTRSAKLAKAGGADVIVLAPSGTPLAEMATLLIPIDLVFATDPYTPISARLAYAWRSEFLITPRDVIVPYAPIMNEATGQLDGSIFYSVNDNWKVGLQALNLTNEITRTSQVLNNDLLRAPRSWFMNDRRFTLIARATF